MVGESKTGTAVDTAKLWQNLLTKWVEEIISKIQRGEKNFSHLTAQLVVISANFSAFGRGFFDEDRNHADIKVEQGEINLQASSAIENLIIVSNKKLLLPQVYFWAIEEGKSGASGRVKIVKVIPFTQSPDEEKPEEVVSASSSPNARGVKTVTKILLDFKGEVLNNFNSEIRNL